MTKYTMCQVVEAFLEKDKNRKRRQWMLEPGAVA
jgi:hypothetical protein